MKLGKSTKVIKRLFIYSRPMWWICIIGMVCSAIAAACTIWPAYIMKDIVNKVFIAARDNPSVENTNLINWLAWSVVVVMLIKGVASFFAQYSMAYLGQKVLKDIRSECFDKLSRLSLSFYETQRTGDLMSRVTSDVSVLQTIVNDAIRFVSDAVQLVGFCGYIFYLHWKLAIMSIIIAPVIGVTIKKFGKKMKSIGTSTQGKIGEVSTVLQEFVTGIKVIKSFTLEALFKNRFENSNGASFKEIMRGNKISCATTPVIEFVNSCGMALIFWYGGREVAAGRIDPGQIVSFLVALVGLFTPIRDLSRMSNSLALACGAGERVFEIIDKEEEIKEIEKPVVLDKCKGSVEFENVTFYYDVLRMKSVYDEAGEVKKIESDEKIHVLDNVNISVKPGEVIALVGPSGAGKSTFVNLIPRFFDVKGGSIKIDGVDVKNMGFVNMRSFIAMVPQETMLFSGTIEENIKFGKLEATHEEVVESAKKANAHNFIMEQPNGYDTVLGERGINLSGGQAQRVALARAFLKDPAILILDEATSALDSETEQLIKDSLSRLMKGRTTFMIAHRLSTVVDADRIVVINGGKIAEEGKHADLLKLNGIYAQLYKSQYGEHAE